jgi:hypothetical protein
MAHRFVWRCWTSLALAQAVLVQADYISTDTDQYNTGALGHRPHLEFRSSDEYAPLLQINTWSPDAISTTGSHIFLKHDGNDSSPLSSPLILDARDLSAVYMNRSFTNVFGTRVQEDRGKKYLTFWAGDKGDGIGDGYGLAFDDTYRLVYKVPAQNLNGVHADLHEFALTGNGTALVTGVNRIRVRGDYFREIYGWDYPLPDGLEIEILDGVIQEIDLETNELLFDWRALDHINPLDSYEPMGRLWDAYHVNSIEKVFLHSVHENHQKPIVTLIRTDASRQLPHLNPPHTLNPSNQRHNRRDNLDPRRRTERLCRSTAAQCYQLVFSDPTTPSHHGLAAPRALRPGDQRVADDLLRQPRQDDQPRRVQDELFARSARGAGYGRVPTYGAASTGVRASGASAGAEPGECAGARCIAILTIYWFRIRQRLHRLGPLPDLYRTHGGRRNSPRRPVLAVA